MFESGLNPRYGLVIQVSGYFDHNLDDHDIKEVHFWEYQRSAFLDYGRHVGQRHRRRTYAPTSNTASHDNHEKINSWVSFSLLYENGAPLGGPSGYWSSASRTDKME